MFQIVGVMLAGVGVGYVFRHVGWLQKTGKTISGTIFLLLFLLGLSIGTNPSVFANLSALGFQAFLLAVAGTFGSVLAAWFVYRFIFGKEESHEG